jgi:hypothetical protein
METGSVRRPIRDKVCRCRIEIRVTADQCDRAQKHTRKVELVERQGQGDSGKRRKSIIQHHSENRN